MEIIRIKACEGLRPKDVIAELGCSRRILEMRFKESTGHSIGDEICTVRMQYVKELLLRSNVQIESIAARCVAGVSCMQFGIRETNDDRCAKQTDSFSSLWYNYP